MRAKSSEEITCAQSPYCKACIQTGLTRSMDASDEILDDIQYEKSVENAVEVQGRDLIACAIEPMKGNNRRHHYCRVQQKDGGKSWKEQGQVSGVSKSTIASENMCDGCTCRSSMLPVRSYAVSCCGKAHLSKNSERVNLDESVVRLECCHRTVRSQNIALSKMAHEAEPARTIVGQARGR